MNKTISRSLLLLFAMTVGLAATAEGRAYRPDPWITLKTKIALLTTDNLDAHTINVDTINAHVTLHGKVDSGAEKALAEQVAGTIEGTKQVRNLLQVVPENKRKLTNLDDAAINERARAALSSDATLADGQIAIKSVNKGVVLLSGTAASLTDHLRAIRDVVAIDGVRRVASEVRSPDVVADREIVADEEQAHATPPSSESGMKQGFADMWITTATKSRLMVDRDTPAMDINVDTDDGVVTLFGIVSSQAAKKAAEADAKKVSGVRAVHNDLQVVPAKDTERVAVRDDEALKESEKALKGHDELERVSVDVKNGVARLTGTVSNASDRIMAGVFVRACAGVRAVENDVTVKQP